MADRSNYADKPQSPDAYMPPGGFPESFGARTYDPESGMPAEGARYSHLAEESVGGDWSWKPHRNKQFPQNMMPAFMGVPPSAAELYGPRTHS